MGWLAVAVVFALFLWPLVVSIRRATELFVVQVDQGRARFVRGRMPQNLLHDIADVVGSPPVTSAEIRAVRRSGEAELVVSGELGPGQFQQLRNVIGCYPVQRIMAGGRPGRRRG